MNLSPESQVTQQNSAEILDLLRVMTGILRRFAGLMDRDLDQGITASLASIGEHVAVDRCYLFIVSNDGTAVSNTHEWCADGISPQIDNLKDVSFETLSWWKPRLEAGDSIYIPCVVDLPDSRRAERELLAPQSIQSLLVVPLMDSDRLRGFLGFDSVRQQREWSDEAQLLLRAVADILVGAIVRQDMLSMLLAKERQFTALVEYSTDVLMVLDRRSCFSYLSPTAVRLLGLRDHYGGGRSLLDYCHPSDRNALSGALAATNSGSIEALPDFRLQCASGGWTWLMGTARDLSDDPAVSGIVINAKDISDRKEAEESLQLQAAYDSLTGLPNRSFFSELLFHAIGRCQRSGDRLGILFIDLDHFKLINDGQGHRVGDELLVDVAQRMRRELRQEDTIARFGGDEFVAMLNAPRDRDADLAYAAERILRVFKEPFAIEGVGRSVTASAGLAITDGSTSAEEILANADAAMYLAKESGRACLRHFNETLRDQLMKRVELEKDLRGACQRNEMRLHYQPIFDTFSNALIGFEALLRWEHPERGLVPPDYFIPAAEQSGSIVELGAWVLDEAISQLQRWADRYPQADLYISVNLSPVQLRDPTFPEVVQSTLDRWKLPASSLCLEVTESALMEYRERSIAALERLRNLGVMLAIDDFGTGYSSLAYLRDLPVEMLKVDKSFVQKIDDDLSDHSIVAAIQHLADAYNLKTIAEGVETEGQELALQTLGYERLQGFRLGRPRPAAEAEVAIREGRQTMSC